ncbi:MAG: SpoIIIAH-like family protein [Eubacterium sp.]|nr:SpoIIIAH-like family protein [Eubacterium sp.]
MKKLLRKNQIIITALVVMVALAGYLSVTEEDKKTVLTSQNTAVTDDGLVELSEEDIILDEEDATGASVSASKDNAGEAVLVSSTVEVNYFEEAKLSREQTRAKNKETLTELVNNANATDKQKEKAMEEIMKMTDVSEKETATETLLAAKGFPDAVVTILEDGVDVVVNAETLTEQQIAQIEDIVKRKTEMSSQQIVISPVGKKQ